MEYEEELVHNALAIARALLAQNANVSLAKRVEDNTLNVITAPVIALQPTMPQDPAANPLCTLLKAPNALVIK